MRLRHVDAVTASELKNMQDVLVSKETEVVQSKSTARGLATGQHGHAETEACPCSGGQRTCAVCAETERLQQDLEKVQQLEGKINSELSSLKERISTMESELTVYRDLDNLRLTADTKKKVFGSLKSSALFLIETVEVHLPMFSCQETWPPHPRLDPLLLLQLTSGPLSLLPWLMLTTPPTCVQPLLISLKCFPQCRCLCSTLPWTLSLSFLHILSLLSQ